MKKLIKKLCSALIVTIVMRPGLEAAPHEASSARRIASPAAPATKDQVDEAQSKTIHHIPPLANHINDLKGPGYEVHVHDYHPPPPPEYSNTVVDILKYFEKTFHFIDIVDKNDLLATDLVDSSWYQWLDYMHQVWPLISSNKIHADNIENPQHDAPGSLWNSLLYLMLKRQDVHAVDKTGGNKENDLNVQYTTIKFDPIGQLFHKGWNIIKEYSGFDSISKWWKDVKLHYHKYSAFKPEKIAHEEILTEEVEDGIHYPEGVLTMSLYDPVVLGVNTLLFIGWHILFWASYLPVSGVENMFADYPDIDPDNPDGADDADYPGDDADYPAYDDDADYPAYDDDADYPADGDDGGGRRDYHNAYKYYDEYGEYIHYDYFDRVHRGSESDHARTHIQETHTDSLSSNYYSHGAVEPHEAYTLADTNIFVKKK